MPDRPPISLVNGDQLVNLMIQNGIGISAKSIRVITLDAGSLIPQDESGEDVSEGGLEQELAPASFGEAAVVEAEPSKFRRRTTSPSGGKSVWFWPLPGGQANYLTSLLTIAGYVSEEQPTLDELVGWLQRTYPQVRSKQAAIQYLRVPRVAGLMTARGEQFVMTAEGAAVLASGDREDLFRLMASRIAGLEEIQELLHGRQLTVAEITAKVNEILGTNWRTDAQVQWRLGWLENFGRVKRQGDGWLRVNEA